MIRSIKSYLSLKRIGYAFTDTVDGRGVYYYRDCYGDIWMKNSRWGLFRCGGGDTEKDDVATNISVRDGIQRKRM
jgi:hypothetical protein